MLDEFLEANNRLGKSEVRHLRELERRLKRDRLIISISYLLVGSIWMYFSSGIYIPYVLNLTGPAIYLEVVKELIFVALTAVLLYYALFILHRREIALATQLAEAELKQADLKYMRELTSLVGGITHDLRNILQLIGLHLISREDISADEFRRRAEIVAEEIKRIARMCDTMTAAAAGAQGSGEPEEIDLVRFVEREIELVRPLIKRGEITFQAKAGLHPIKANLITLHRLLINLLYNACQAAGEDGTVRVWLENLNGKISIGVENTGKPLPSNVVEALNAELDLSSLVQQSHGWGLGIVVESLSELNARIRAETTSQGTLIQLIMETER